MYYVYVYLDPRRPGKFCYNELESSFLFEPFYIGKGKGKRCFDHLKETMNKSKKERISELLDMNNYPIIIILKYFDIEDIAYDYEKLCIENIGRVLYENGPLLNYMAGGKCGCTCSEIMQTDEMKRIMSNRTTSFFKDPKNRKRASDNMKKIMATPEMKYKVSKAQTRRFRKKSERDAHSERMKDIWKDPTRNHNMIKFNKRERTTEEREAMRHRMIEEFKTSRKRKYIRKAKPHKWRKDWKIINEAGQVIETRNLKQFCIKNELPYGIFRSRVFENNETYKGWRKL